MEQNKENYEKKMFNFLLLDLKIIFCKNKKLNFMNQEDEQKKEFCKKLFQSFQKNLNKKNSKINSFIRCGNLHSLIYNRIILII